MTFECIFSGTTQSPSWNIDGENYYISELPPKHAYDVPSMSLIISPVERRMNNSVYYCFFVTYSEAESQFVTISSEHAVLVIQPFIHTMSRQESSDSVLTHTIMPTRTVCCRKTISAHLTSPATATTITYFHFSLSRARSLKLLGTSTVQSHTTISSTLLITSDLTTMIETIPTSIPGDMQNLPVQGFHKIYID